MARAAPAADRHQRGDLVRLAGAAEPSSSATSELSAQTSVAAAEPLDATARSLVKLEESPFYRGGRRPGRRLGRARLGRGRGAGRGRLPGRRRPGAAGLRPRALAGERRAGHAPGSTTRRATRRCETTPRPTCCTRRCASGSAPTCARRARRCAPTSFASTSPTAAPLNADGAARGRGSRQRVGQGKPPGAGDADGARRGRGARRDGAVRREVRRVGAGGRGRRGLARALRRHPRRQHRRGRDRRDRLRGLERRERAPRSRRSAARRRSTTFAGAATSSTRPAGCSARPRDPLGAARRAAERLAELERQTERARREQAGVEAERLGAAGDLVAGVRVIVSEGPSADQRELLELADRIKQRAGEAAVVLGGAGGGKVALVATFTPDAIAKRAQRGDGDPRGSRRSSAAAEADARTSRRRAGAILSASATRSRPPARRSTES